MDVFRFATTIDFGMGGKRITQKAVASSDGSAIVAVAPMAAGKQVFLGAIITPPTVMQSMTSEDTTNKKRPTAVKKSPAGAGTKTVAEGNHLHPC